MAIEGKEGSSQVRDAMQKARAAAAADNTQEQNTRNAPEAREERVSRREGSRRQEVRYASLSQIGRLNPTPIAMTNTAQALEQFRKDFADTMPSREDNNVLETCIYDIDSAAAGLPFSLLVVAGTKRGREDLGVGYHTFVIAGSAEPLRPREETYNGHRVSIVQVPGDAYDKRCRAVIKEVLQRDFPNLPHHSADAEVIWNGFPSAKDNPEAIADCVKNAFAAIKTAIDRVDPDAPRLRLIAEENQDSHNSVHIQHRQNHIFDRAHQPVRADVVIDLNSRETRGRNSRDQIDQLVTGMRIARLGGYYDLVYAPMEEADSRNDLYGRRDGRRDSDMYKLYALRFVTTFCDTVDFSPTTQLLGMALINAAGESSEVMRAFEPNTAMGEDDMRNPGVLAIEPNLQDMERGFGERMDTKVSTFTSGKRSALLRTVIRPGLIHSIDVPECGASTWQWVDMMAAAEGSKTAMDRIYDAACDLTDGHFEDFYRRGDMIVDPHVERIVGGYYTEGDSILDIRDLDYIAILNLLDPQNEGDLKSIQLWGLAASSNEDSLLSQSDRYDIIRSFLPTAVVTGYYQRYNINVDFNDALLQAINKCKLSLNPTSSGRDGGDRYRTTYGNIDQILNRAGSGGLYRNQRQNRERFDDRYVDRREDRNDSRW